MVESMSVGRSVFPNQTMGFTLLEVMIVVALIGILSAIAYPSYLSYITRANRAAAQGFMLEVSNRQERYLLDNRGYATAIGTGAGLLAVTIPNNVSANYTVTTTSPRPSITTPSYSVDAAPTGTQATRDADCGILSIDETGAKSISGTGTVTSCWRQ